MSDETRTEGEPHDRLTRIANRVAQYAEFDLERFTGDRCIVCLMNDDEKRGGIGIFGYDDDIDAFTDLFLHMRSIMRTQGKDVVIAPLRGGPDS